MNAEGMEATPPGLHPQPRYLVAALWIASGIATADVSGICPGLDEPVGSFGTRALDSTEFPRRRPRRHLPPRSTRFGAVRLVRSYATGGVPSLVRIVARASWTSSRWKRMASSASRAEERATAATMDRCSVWDAWRRLTWTLSIAD